MDKIIKAKWVEALRSGEYKQGKGVLRGSDMTKPTYCCLGVLCDVYKRHTGRGKWKTDQVLTSNGSYTLGYIPFELQGSAQSSYLPSSLASDARLVELDPVLNLGETKLF